MIVINKILKVKIGIIFLLIVQLNSCASTKDQLNKDFNLYKSWKVYKHLAGSVTAITTAQADYFMNKEIVISRDGVSTFSGSCSHYELEKRNVKVNEYFDSFKIDSDELGINQVETELFLLNCSEKDESFEFIRNGNELIFTHEGFAFLLK